jgi:hypothetical protein
MTENNELDPMEDEEIIELTDIVETPQEADEEIVELTDAVVDAAETDEAEVGEAIESVEQLEAFALDYEIDEAEEMDHDDDDFADSLGYDLESEPDDEEASDEAAVTEELSIPTDQLEAALERVLEKLLSDKLEQIVNDVLEKAVTKEMDRLKSIFLENSPEEE